MTTLIVKPTEYCNANCTYCAVSEKDAKKERMSIDMLRLLMERIAEHIVVDDSQQINITWHGGEPALMGADFYRAVALLQQQVLGRNAGRLRHTIQTNLTVMNDEIVGALKLLGITSFGTSYDPTPGVRGIGRACESDVYNKKFFAGLELLRRHGIGAGVIFVVTSRTVDAPVESMKFFSNLLGKKYRGHFRMNPMYMEGEALRTDHGLGITAEQYGHFLGRAYEYWYPRRHLLANVNPFSGFCRKVEGEPAQLSCEELGACGDTHLSVAANGDIYQCGRAMDNLTLHYGNLTTLTLEQAFRSPLKQDLRRRSAHLRTADCAECDLWQMCHGGCPVDGQISYADWRHRTNFCTTKHILFERYVFPIHRAAGTLRAEAADLLS